MSGDIRITTHEYLLPLPSVDEWGTPTSKMPNCPHCGDDELGMIFPDQAVCNRCSAIVVRTQPGQQITAVPAICGQCPWKGTVEACEPSDGDLLCPQCLNEISIKTERRYVR